MLSLFVTASLALVGCLAPTVQQVSDGATIQNTSALGQPPSAVEGASDSSETPPVAAADEIVAIRALFLHMGDGQVVENGVLVVRGGIIAAAGAIEIPAGARVIEHAGHVSPGLVAAYSAGYLNWSETNESTRPFLPDAQVALGFDALNPRLHDALEAGVTTIVLAPGVTQVVGGRTAVVKTYGGKIVSNNAHLALSMSSTAASADRYPTSYASIVQELDARFTNPQGAYREAQTGNLGLFDFVRARHETDRALRLFQRHGLKGALVGCELPGELAARLEAAQCQVVLPTPGFAPNEREMASLAKLAAAAVPFAFWLDDPNQFRASAAVARRAGATADEALGSICWYAADIARVGTSVGRLVRGYDADFVLWSGDPIDLTSRVQAVYVSGELAFRGDQ